jgi:glucosyl-3-phosphoglycerate phosphatase|tara:strand:- start:6660 stop:7322 length:663 start_codon:yes stop_codon:yes gene_type:complete
VANRIVIWRHGQTDWNIANRFQGHSDIPLNEVGQFQVTHAARVLAPMEPTMIISSDLNRARNTAHALAELAKLEIGIDERLRETHGGSWEGKTGAENRAVDLQNFIRWLDGEDIPAGGTGETRSQVAARASAAIDEALAGKDNQLLVVATHGGTARCLLGHYLQLPYSHWARIGGLSNASWSVLGKSPVKGWYLAEHNAGSIPEPIYGEESGAELPDSVR